MLKRDIAVILKKQTLFKYQELIKYMYITLYSLKEVWLRIHPPDWVHFHFRDVFRPYQPSPLQVQGVGAAAASH